MKHHIFSVLLLLSAFIITSCEGHKRVTKKYAAQEKYLNYLSSVINDTVYYEYNEYSIIDSGICQILDTAIVLSEKCSYFDHRIRYLNSFRFGVTRNNDKLIYDINTNLSPASALGRVFVGPESIDKDQLGVFYYRNHLFVVPLYSKGTQRDSDYSGFLRSTGKRIKVRAPEFFELKPNFSHISFSRVVDSFAIVEIKVCSPIIVIR